VEVDRDFPPQIGLFGYMGKIFIPNTRIKENNYRMYIVPNMGKLHGFKDILQREACCRRLQLYKEKN